MSDDDPGDLLDQEQWRSILAGDELLAEPAAGELPRPLAATAALTLNTHDVPWETFERLVLAIAKQVELAMDVRIYGRRGQQQHGIDIVGFFLPSAATVYQAKRYEIFTARDLEKAVKKYADGKRPFNATRLVIVTACDASDTAVVEKLESLRETYSDLTLDLWDRVALSDMLHEQPGIVKRFFGSATAATFCGTDTAPEPALPTISPDAIVRGPILHFGLADELASAQAAVTANPTEAARLFGIIADRLQETPFAGHAINIRRRQATALDAASQPATAFAIRLGLAWALIDSTNLWSAHQLLAEMAASEHDLPESLVRSANALQAAVSLRREHWGSVEEMVAAFDELQEGDPFREVAGVVTSEECIIAGELIPLQKRAPLLLQLASSTGTAKKDQLIGARIRACVAEAIGDWSETLTVSRRLYEPSIDALVVARHARHLALTRNPEQSLSRYLDASERATGESQYGDASAWLYAHRAVRVRYGYLKAEDEHHLAQALQSLGSERVLPGGDAREQALAELKAEDWPDALECARRYLWHATVSGAWAEEIEAHEMLGSIYQETGRREEALHHYVKAGKAERAEQLAAEWPERPIDFQVELGLCSWERSAAYEAVAAIADKVPDDDATRWAHSAFSDLTTNPLGFGPLGQVGLASFSAFASLSLASGVDDAEGFLGFAAELVDREEGRYRPTDPDHALALMSIARVHPRLRQRALEQALDLFVQEDQQVGRAILKSGEDILRLHPLLVDAKLRESAQEGRLLANIAIVLAGSDREVVVPFAEDRLRAALEPRVRSPHEYSIGGSGGTDGLLISVLGFTERTAFVEAMLPLVIDKAEPAPNRQDALLSILLTATGLNAEIRRRIFEVAMQCAQGLHDAALGGDPFTLPPDPLSRFQFHMGPQSLAGIGVRCAAGTAESEEDFALVRRVGIQLLRDASDLETNEIAHGLSRLPREVLMQDLEVFSTHSSEWLRSVAAVVWAASPGESDEIGLRLASDKSPHVRRSLAMAVRTAQTRDAVRNVLCSDVRRSVRLELVDSVEVVDE